MSEWMPIDTAPPNTEILCLWKGRERRGYLRGRSIRDARTHQSMTPKPTQWKPTALPTSEGVQT
jgi:hypothetical protein